MLSPLTTQEAVLSSKIEGTQATLDEVLKHEAGIPVSGEKEMDIQEVLNYRKVLMVARDEVAERPISLHLLREMHKVLLDSVRGADKSPGEFRKVQNYIGKPGATIDRATYVPPAPLQVINSLEKWDAYVQGDDIDVLIQAAVTHAQFELIHPFKDGNGRIGRLLIPLFLFQKKSISSPIFYLSAYFEEHRDEYYASLRTISQDREWNNWIAFFLTAVSLHAQKNALKVRQIMDLYEEMKKCIFEITHSRFSLQLLDALFDRPIFGSTDLITRTDIPRPTAMVLIRQLRESGIISTLREKSGKASAVFAFKKLLNIAEGRPVF